MTHSPFRRLARIVLPWHMEGNEIFASPLVWLHLFFWAGLLLACWQVNRWTGMERWLRSSWPMLHRVWLPLLVVLIYAILWLCSGLWQALRRDGVLGSCPEVDAAWNEAMAGLELVGTDLGSKPLFLILGPLSPDLLALLESVGASSVSARAAARLQVFAHQDANFVALNSSVPLGAKKGAVLALAGLYRLCQLLRRDRLGKPALQGVILAAPFRALQSDAELDQTIERFRAELSVVREATGLDCPLHVAVAGLAAISECAAQGWFQRFPRLPNEAPEEMTLALKEGVDQMCRQTIPHMLFRQMRLDGSAAPSGTLTETLRGNVRHYQFLTSVESWRGNFVRLLLEGSANEFDEPGRIVGCYFLPGSGEQAGQSLVGQAILDDLLAHQHLAASTPEAQAERDQQLRITRKGYGMLLAGWASVLAGAAWLIGYRWW